MVEGKPEPIRRATARVKVLGLLMLLRGRATRHTLRQALDNVVEKQQDQVTFDVPDGTYQLTAVQTEEQLTALVRGGQFPIGIMTRVRLPRIRVDAIYWPPSERTAEIVVRRVKGFLAGELPDPRPLSFDELEGTDLKAIWEPIWHGHPATAATEVPCNP